MRKSIDVQKNVGLKNAKFGAENVKSQREKVVKKGCKKAKSAVKSWKICANMRKYAQICANPEKSQICAKICANMRKYALRIFPPLSMVLTNTKGDNH